MAIGLVQCTECTKTIIVPKAAKMVYRTKCYSVLPFLQKQIEMPCSKSLILNSILYLVYYA